MPSLPERVSALERDVQCIHQQLDLIVDALVCVRNVLRGHLTTSQATCEDGWAHKMAARPCTACGQFLIELTGLDSSLSTA